MDKPNILWICSDQQRWDTLGCYGNSFVRTPNLDHLAEQGVLFERCYTQSPVCTPSRSGFLTGRYPRTTRCRQNGQNIPRDERLVTSLLAKAGYTCGLAGKLHLSACEPHVCQTMERRIDDGYAEFHWAHHAGKGWGSHNEYWAWLQEKGRRFETHPCPDSTYVQLGMPPEFHHTTWCAEKAIDFIRDKAKTGKPWLFSLNMFDPHHPFDAPGEYLERYLEILDEIPLPNYSGEMENTPPFQRIDHNGAYGGRGGYYSYDEMTDTDHRLVRASYWAMCDLIDVQMGRVFEVLEETGQLNNTIVIFMSDHGEMLGDHGIYLKGPYFYEPAVRVPLIISCPGLITPQRNSDLVELVDMAPTLLDAAGLPRYPGMQSQSLWPVLQNDESERHHRDDVYCEYYNALTSHRDPTAHLTMVRTDRYKIVADHSNGTGELYDLTNDPDENHNLWNDPNSNDAKMEMLFRLCNRMAWTVDPLPERISNW